MHTQKRRILVTFVGLTETSPQFKAQRGDGIFEEVEGGATIVEKDRSRSMRFVGRDEEDVETLSS